MKAAEEGWELDREQHVAEWRKRGWPGPPSLETARILRVAQLWYAFGAERLELAVEASGLRIPASRAEGYLMRLGMAYGYWQKRAEEARKDGR